MKPEQWIVNGDVGISSKTIWAVMMNAVMKDNRNAWLNYGVPLDPDDLQRCVKLLAFFPEWRHRLPEVAHIFPEWTPLIREWDMLEKRCWKWIADNYGQEDEEHASALYDFMRKLIEEGRELILEDE